MAVALWETRHLGKHHIAAKDSATYAKLLNRHLMGFYIWQM